MADEYDKEHFPDWKFIPIDDAAKQAERILGKRGDYFFACRWHEPMKNFIYAVPDDDYIEVCLPQPTHYGVKNAE